jgi:predicted transcriptional regulator
MLTKTKLRAEIENFPDEFSIDELVERLIFIEKVENGLKQSEAGNIVSEEELECYINQLFVDK